MSYQERRAIVATLSTIMITVLYTAYRVPHYPQQASPYAPEVFRYWGEFIIILIPVSIVARIVIHVVFSIMNTLATQEQEPSLVDERDRMIELKASQNALIVFSVGFVLAMASLVLDQPPAVMFALLLCAGLASDVISEMSSFFFYRRGY